MYLPTFHQHRGVYPSMKIHQESTQHRDTSPNYCEIVETTPTWKGREEEKAAPNTQTDSALEEKVQSKYTLDIWELRAPHPKRNMRTPAEYTATIAPYVNRYEYCAIFTCNWVGKRPHMQKSSLLEPYSPSANSIHQNLQEEQRTAGRHYEFTWTIPTISEGTKTSLYSWTARMALKMPGAPSQ